LRPFSAFPPDVGPEGDVAGGVEAGTEGATEERREDEGKDGEEGSPRFRVKRESP
jgi:hypothetical protein